MINSIQTHCKYDKNQPKNFITVNYFIQSGYLCGLYIVSLSKHDKINMLHIFSKR